MGGSGAAGAVFVQNCDVYGDSSGYSTRPGIYVTFVDRTGYASYPQRGPLARTMHSTSSRLLPVTADPDNRSRDAEAFRPSLAESAFRFARPALGPVAVGTGFGLLLAAITVAALAILYGTGNASDHFYGTEGKIRFTDIRLPVNAAVIVLAGVVLALASLAAVTRTLQARAATVLTSIVALFVLIVMSAFFFFGGSTLDDADIYGTGTPGTIAALAMTVGGLVLLAPSMIVTKLPPSTARRSVLMVCVTLAVMVACVVTLAPPMKSPGAQMISITIGDRHRVDADLPTRVDPAPRKISDTVEGAYAIGPGFVTTNRDETFNAPGSVTVYNGDNLAVRWRLAIVGDPFPTLVTRVFPAQEVVVVIVSGFPDGRRNFGIDASSGELLWETADTWSLLGPDNEQPPSAQVRHLVVTDNAAKAFSLFSPRSGRQLWEYRPRDSCTQVDFAERGSTVALLLQCGSERAVHVLDSTTGRLIARNRTDSAVLDDRNEALPSGFRFVYGKSRSFPEAIVDTRNRRIVDLTDRDIDCDTVSNDCILEEAGADRASIISLSGTHPPLAIKRPRTSADDGVKYGSALWLRDQVLWPERATSGSSSSSDHIDRVVAVDRQTGEASIAADVAGHLTSFRGGVVVTANGLPQADSDSAWTLSGAR